MDGIHTHFTVRTSFSFLILILLQTSTEAQGSICSAPQSVDFRENNGVDDTVVTIALQSNVIVEFQPPPANPNNPFRLEGNRLIATRVLDYETEPSHIVSLTCTNTVTEFSFPFIIAVILVNVNDNPPVFDHNVYNVTVNEMSPVDTSVGRFAATDLDNQKISYTLTPESNGFKLRSPTDPDLLVETPLDYDKVKNVQLTLSAQDSPLVPSDSSSTTNTTIMITIVDVDNRPPWFQPCIKHEIGGALICQSNGYTGSVVLNEQETGVLPLKPEPIHAIDGDSGINEEITYSFLNGDGDGLFEINPNTGNISMQKPADVLETISLTVLAAQKVNPYQFAITTVAISVQVKSNHTPQFERPHYEGVVSAVGSMVLDLKNKDEPLRILATDEDYTATGGKNPHITYYINSSDFSIIDGYLFMTKDPAQESLSLEVKAIDSSNEDSATAQLTVEVTSGLTTTTLPQSTTDSTGMTSIGESTTNSKTTEDTVSTTNPSMTSEGTTQTTSSSMSTEDSVSATNPSLTSEGSVSTASTAPPHTAIVPSGGYGPADMAAVGATLGVLLFICLVVIGVLAVRMKREKADWKKIYETNKFRSSLSQGSGGHKPGIQYTNDAFQKDEDGESTGSGGSNKVVGGELQKTGLDFKFNEDVKPSVTPDLLRDDTSLAGSDKADSEKEVKPILTKERRMDDGYKSVWFKEDIDPDAKEEVVIIPDSREDDSEEEDEEQSSSGGEEDEDDNPQIKTPRVFFSDADLDSGLGVKMEDPAEDSDDDEVLNVDL